MNPAIAHYQQQLHLQKAHFSPIEHEEAIVAVVFKVAMPDGEQFILKICPQASHYLREVYFLNHFAAKQSGRHDRLYDQTRNLELDRC